jgi:hypothetical protein
MRSLLVAVVVVLVWASTSARDAVKVLPDNYQVQFENEYVRVTRVHYPPHAKLPGHTHTSLATAYVYLNDAGPVAFKHVGLEYGAVTRPATVARSYRLFRGLEEIHEVENLSPTASEFLRVEFKTDPGPDPRTLRGKFLPPAPGSEAAEKVEFENAQVRVTRLVVTGGSEWSMDAAPYPAVLIAVSPPEVGKARWVPRNTPVRASTQGERFEALRFELKTPPRP